MATAFETFRKLPNSYTNLNLRNATEITRGGIIEILKSL